MLLLRDKTITIRSTYNHNANHILFDLFRDSRTVQSIPILLVDKPIVLLPLPLATPTWLWGRCCKHNSPPASSVMELIFRRSDGSHVSVDTVNHAWVDSRRLIRRQRWERGIHMRDIGATHRCSKQTKYY